MNPNFEGIHRPCPFEPCKNTGKLYSVLTRHMKTVHRHEPTVARAMSLPRRERVEAFTQLRKCGIFCFNKEEMTKDIPDFMPERNSNADNNLVVCYSCKGVFAKNYKASHQLHCGRNTGQVMIVHSINLMEQINTLDLDIRSVLNKMIVDEVLNLAKKDSVILMIGPHTYKK